MACFLNAPSLSGALYKCFVWTYIPVRASLVAQAVKNPPAVWQIWVRSLDWEDPLEEGMATTPVLLPGESHGQRSLAGYSPWGCKESDTTGRLSTAQHTRNRCRLGACVGLALEALEGPRGPDRLIPEFRTPRGLGRLPAECSQKEWGPFFAFFPVSSLPSAMELPPQHSGCCWREMGCSSHVLQSWGRQALILTAILFPPGRIHFLIR